MPDPLIHALKLMLKICTEWQLCYSTMRSFFETPQGYWPILSVLKNCAHWAITKHYLSHIKTLWSTVDDGVKFLNWLFSQTILLLKQITHPVELCVCQPHHLFISLLNIIHVLSYGVCLDWKNVFIMPACSWANICPQTGPPVGSQTMVIQIHYFWNDWKGVICI